MALVCNHLNSDRWRLKILLPLFLYCIAGTTNSKSITLSPPTDITCLVLKRLYVVARLEKMCTRFFAARRVSPTKWVRILSSFVQSVFATQPHPAVGILTEMLPRLRHNHIRFHVEAIVSTQSIEPLYALWQELCAYRFLDDDLFTQEFCQLMYVVFARCMKEVASRTEPYTQNSAYNKSASQEIQSLTPNQARAIAQRFYLIERLQHAVALCTDVYRSSGDPALKIMLSLWDDIQQYKNIDTPTVSFGICSSVIALLDNAQNQHRLAAPTIESPWLDASHSEIADQAALEKLLEYIDSIADS